MMKKLATILTIGAAALVLAGCSASGTNPTSPSRVCSLSSNVLEFNVGAATLPSGATGTNVAVTYRQSASGNCYAGNSGALVSTPTLTVPAAAVFPAPAPTSDAYGATLALPAPNATIGGPGPGEAAAHNLTSIGQSPSVDVQGATATTFGVEGGAFGLGLEPFNYTGTLGSPPGGVPATLFPYPVPVYDTVAADVNQFTPGGGPPAFNTAGNTAATLAGFNGISEGFDVFGGLAPATGTYTLSVAVPANTGTVTATGTAAISTGAAPVLPPVVAPVPATYTAATGVLTFGPQVFPAGVTQEYIEVTDIGPTMGGVSCVGATPANPVYYTTVLTAAGTPAPIPAPGLCSAAANTTASGGTATDGDEFGVQLIGLDYNWYGASYTGIAGVGGTGVPAPSLTGTGASHQADITISPLTEYTLPGGNVLVGPLVPVTPLVAHRR